jgi:plasmid maintenance system antidote protein VapI
MIMVEDRVVEWREVEFEEPVHPGYYLERSVQWTGKSVDDFAKECGIHPGLIKDIISGKALPSDEVCDKLAHLLKHAAESIRDMTQVYVRDMAQVRRGPTPMP